MKLKNLVLMSGVAMLVSSSVLVAGEMNMAQQVLQQPAVASLVKHMVQQYGDACKVPTEADVMLLGTGLITPVTKPVIETTGVFFDFQMNCGKEKMAIEGMIESYYLNSPDENAPRLNTPGVVVIDSIEFTSK